MDPLLFFLSKNDVCFDCSVSHQTFVKSEQSLKEFSVDGLLDGLLDGLFKKVYL